MEGCCTLVTEKILQKSDVERQQNRFLIPIADVRDRLIPFLYLDEQRDASLLFLDTKKRKKYDKKESDADGEGGDRGRKQTEVGRKHGGLAARLVAGDREIGVTLTQWDGTLGAVLKGGAQWKIVVAEQQLRPGDRVQLLAFRRRTAAVEVRPGETPDLYFLLRRKEDTRGDDGAAAAEPVPEARRIANIDRSESLDLSISLNLPVYSAPRSTPDSAPKTSVVESKEEVSEENGLNLSLTLRQPASTHDLN